MSTFRVWGKGRGGGGKRRGYKVLAQENEKRIPKAVNLIKEKKKKNNRGWPQEKPKEDKRQTGSGVTVQTFKFRALAKRRDEIGKETILGTSSVRKRTRERTSYSRSLKQGTEGS